MRQQCTMAGMLSKAAHIINVLALIPGAFLGYVAWIIHHQDPNPPKFVSIRNIDIALGLFLGFNLISALLGLIALLRGNRRPAEVRSS